MDRYSVTVIACNNNHRFMVLIGFTRFFTSGSYGLFKNCWWGLITVSTCLNPPRLLANSDTVRLKVQRVIPFRPAGGVVV